MKVEGQKFKGGSGPGNFSNISGLTIPPFTLTRHFQVKRTSDTRAQFIGVESDGTPASFIEEFHVLKQGKEETVLEDEPFEFESKVKKLANFLYLLCFISE